MPQNPTNNGHLSQKDRALLAKDRNGNSLSVLQAESYCGPIPHPDMMERYEVICPGATDRILTMTENQSNHRMKCENTYLNRSLNQSMLGQIFAFIIGMTGIVGSIFLLSKGITGAGLTTFIISLGSLVAAFVVGKRKNDSDVGNKKNSEK